MRAALAPAAAALLAGCAVGPDYVRPPVPSARAAERDFVSRTGALTTPTPLPDRWWSLYADPDIDRLVEAAFAANTDLRQAIARLERARAVLAEARSQFLPATDISGGLQYGRGGGAGGGGGGGATSSGAQVVGSAGLGVAYEVDLFGRVRRSVEGARADVDAEAAAADFVRVTTAAETTRAYTGACAAGAQLIVARQSLRLVRDQYSLSQRQAELGALAQVELDRQRALVEQTAAVVPPLENTRRAALFNLALLTARAPAELDASADRCARLPALARPIPTGDGRALLARRPDVREAERRLAAATARIGVATADLYPTITLGGSVSAAGTGIGSAFSRQGLSFSLGPLISWVFPNVVAARARIDQAEAGVREALAVFDGAVLSALNEAERALTAYATEADRNGALRRAVVAQTSAFRAIQDSARLGGSSPLDVLDTERTLVAARIALAASDALLVDRQVDVFRALGGGWQDATGQPATDANRVETGASRSAASAARTQT